MKITRRCSVATAVLLSTISTVSVLADPKKLSESDKKQLIEKLEEMRQVAEESSKSRFAVALAAFREAIMSAAATHELYLKCVEKANFLDQKIGSQDFREWKRKHKENRDSLEFRRALQHQLNWLLLSIEASMNPDEIESLGVRALAKVDAIMDDHELLKDHKYILNQNVLSSIFAKAYNIDGLQAEKWPLAPLMISNIYEKVVMPPLRNASSITSLRGAWKKRIEHEGLILKNWGKLPDNGRLGVKKDMVSPEFEKWQEDGYLQLLWAREIDCYNAGDESVAAANMLAHLSKYMSNKQSLEWTKQFQAMMSPEHLDEEGKSDEGVKE